MSRLRLTRRASAPDEPAQPALSEYEHIDCLERTREALRIVEEAFDTMAMHGDDDFTRGKAAGRSLMVSGISDGVSEDIGRFYGDRPGQGMHPLSLRLGGRGMESRNKLKALGEFGRVEMACAGIRSAVKLLGQLRDGLGEESVDGRLAAERIRSLSYLLAVCEADSQRLMEAAA